MDTCTCGYPKYLHEGAFESRPVLRCSGFLANDPPDDREEMDPDDLTYIEEVLDK